MSVKWLCLIFQSLIVGFKSSYKWNVSVLNCWYEISVEMLVWNCLLKFRKCGLKCWLELLVYIGWNAWNIGSMNWLELLVWRFEIHLMKLNMLMCTNINIYFAPCISIRSRTNCKPIIRHNLKFILVRRRWETIMYIIFLENYIQYHHHHHQQRFSIQATSRLFEIE